MVPAASKGTSLSLSSTGIETAALAMVSALSSLTIGWPIALVSMSPDILELPDQIIVGLFAGLPNNRSETMLFGESNPYGFRNLSPA